jgi:hypothetical protein
VREGSSNRAYSFFIILFILTVAFSLTSAGILNGNMAMSIDSYAKKSKESSEESSRVGSGSSNKSGGSSSGSDSKSSSDNSNKEGSRGNSKNNDQGTNDNEQQQQQEPGSNDGSNTGADNNLQSVGPLKTDKREQGTEPIVPLDKTVTPSPLPPTTCEQGSTCTTHQQDLSNRDHSITTTTTRDNKTPFILSIPFP